MSGEDRGDDPAYVDARIPEPLWKRVQELFVEQRGYEPSTPQEALGVLCDLAADGFDAGSSDRTSGTDTDQTAIPMPGRMHGGGFESHAAPGTAPSAEASPAGEPNVPDENPTAALGTAPQTVVDVIDDVFPERWDDRPFGERYLPAVLDEYVDCADRGIDDPERTALRRVAQRGADDAETIREGLVSCVYRSEPLPEDVASEFFSEALEVAYERLRQVRQESDDEAEIPEPLDVELADHDGLSPDTTFEDTPMESPEVVASGEVSFDDLVEDLGGTSEPVVPDGANVESLLDAAHADSRVREVADEVLDEMTGEMFDELENGVDQGTGDGVADGNGSSTDGGATATTLDFSTGNDSREQRRTDSSPVADDAADSASAGGDGTTDASSDERENGRDADQVPGPLSVDPETDCDRCGQVYRVSKLQTVLSEEDGTALLLCPDCRS